MATRIIIRNIAFTATKEITEIIILSKIPKPLILKNGITTVKMIIKDSTNPTIAPIDIKGKAIIYFPSFI